MVRHLVAPFLLVGLGVLGVGCADDSGGGSSVDCPSGQVECEGSCIAAPDETLAWVQQNVFTDEGCAVVGCHAGNNPSALEDLDLRNPTVAFDSLVDIESSQAAPRVLVVPDDSDSSYLINKLLGVEMAENTVRMPTGATEPICDAKIDGVRAWIDAGANQAP